MTARDQNATTAELARMVMANAATLAPDLADVRGELRNVLREANARLKQLQELTENNASYARMVVERLKEPQDTPADAALSFTRAFDIAVMDVTGRPVNDRQRAALWAIAFHATLAHRLAVQFSPIAPIGAGIPSHLLELLKVTATMAEAAEYDKWRARSGKLDGCNCDACSKLQHTPIYNGGKV